MIVLDLEERVRLVTQYDHSIISGELAKHVKDDYFHGLERKEEVVIAITEHDRAWIPLDEAPLLNQENMKPVSFQHYPLEPKVEAYIQGIDEVEAKSLYAAFLCSMHYASFFAGMEEDERVRPFLNHEANRRKRLAEKEQITEEDEAVLFHFKLLQFFDNVSLYICLNPPNCAKEKEISWFRNGFAQTFSWNNKETIKPAFINETTVGLSFSPFVHAPVVDLPYKMIDKSAIEKIGLQKAYHDAKQEVISFTYQSIR
ncbi:DUF3891 family protein [Bacillus tianshenii]|nr:DUF3891 family protein [Bacillus tianshenii]